MLAFEDLILRKSRSNKPVRRMFKKSFCKEQVYAWLYGEPLRDVKTQARALLISGEGGTYGRVR
jgi:hypothetical protein